MTLSSTNRCLTSKSLSEGVLVSSLTPFTENGAIMRESISEQTRNLAGISGVLGLALFVSPQERNTLSRDERVDVIKLVRKSLGPKQIVLADIGESPRDAEQTIADYLAAGADAIICSAIDSNPPQVGLCSTHTSNSSRLRFEFTLIQAMDAFRPALLDTTKLIVAHSDDQSELLGMVFGEDEDVPQYDEWYYTVKSHDHPTACLSSSCGALFHNLNTGCDGVLAALSFSAPSEIARLYAFARQNAFFEAQAMHSKLMPLAAVLKRHDDETRQLIYREAAFYRGIAASPFGCGPTKRLCLEERRNLHELMDFIGLEKIG